MTSIIVNSLKHIMTIFNKKKIEKMDQKMKKKIGCQKLDFLGDRPFQIVNFNCVLNMIRITFLLKEMVEKKANLSLN